jgi:putative transposase
MPSHYYQRTFISDNYYHIYNRGSNKQTIFIDLQDHNTFTEILLYYLNYPTGRPYCHKNNSKVPNLTNHNRQTISLIAYCLMPNHFHLLLKQLSPTEPTTNISNLLRRLTITYAMHFNDKYKRSGNLLQGKFKNVSVNSENQLLYLTKYIHRNPLEINHKTSLSTYPYSSYPTYLNIDRVPWINPKPILDYFSNNNPSQSYQSFVEETPDSIDITPLTLE